MKILAIECSGTPASVAITENGFLKASSFINVKLTHSQTLLKMLDDTLSSSHTDIDDIDGLAIAAGPGSFTGVRIGIAVLKGLAISKNLPCVPVSTLRAIAENFKGTDCLLCAVLDARRNQVYNALFRIKNGRIKRLCDDRAIKSEELKAELLKKRVKAPIIIAGDGTEVFYPFLKGLKNVIKALPEDAYQSAAGVAFAAEEEFLKGNTVSEEQLLPVYLRLPQAERELNLKRGKKE